MEPVLVAIVATPGPLRDGLHLLLRTLTSVDATQLVHPAPLLLAASMPAAPRLIVWHWSDSPAEARRLIAQAQARWPDARIMALVDDEEQGELARAAGVDAILTKGTPASKLLTVVNEQLAAALSSKRHLAEPALNSFTLALPTPS